MDILLLIGFFFGVNFLWGTSLAHISVLPIPEDSIGHRTQYRFQYSVRDEHGDYKTQEEAGEGGKSRGSYAVEEPGGDIRIVQYTTDLDGGFKAHIKVDHGQKSASKLEKIDITAEEMRKLIEENRKKKKIVEEEIPEVDESKSKSYILGPPKKISDIVMEKAAAIREIISKEIEAEEKREAEKEKKMKLKNDNGEEKEEIVVGDRLGEYKIDKKSEKSESPKNIEQVSSLGEKKGEISSSQSSDLNFNQIGISNGRKMDEKISQTTVVRVGLSKRNIEGIKNEDSVKIEDDNNNNDGKEIGEGKQSAITVGEKSVRNIGFKNRIMFFDKPEAGKKLNKNLPKIVLSMNENDKDKKEEEKEEDIVLYSPYENENEGNHKNKFVKVPYEVLKPYLDQVN